MQERQHHSRRDFLQGKAAAETLLHCAQGMAADWLESTTELLLDRIPADPTLHVRATRRAMACEFAVQYHQADRHNTRDFLDAFDIIETVEDQLTIYRPESAVIDVNRQAAVSPVPVDPELFELLKLSLSIFQETKGAFDITSTPLSRTWGFLKRAGRLPTDGEISAALTKVDSNQIELNKQDQTVRFLRQGIEINFNSIGKGYALDQVASFLDERGASDYLWHGGSSSILARGCNRATKDKNWKVGLRHPFEPNKRLAEFHLRNRALGTAGGATQYFEIDGKKYGHILDPRTGWPASGTYTATVLAPTAAEADALATAFYTSGFDGTSDFCSNRPEIGAVLVCPNANKNSIVVHAFNMHADDWTRV